MGRFLTPDDDGAGYLCRRLRFRAELAGFITGTLERLTKPGAWEPFGTMTPEEAAGYALEALNYYADAGDRCMIGEIWIGITADYPVGVLPFDGTQYLRVDYPDLYALLDTAFIDDADHFTLHDAAGRALVLAGSGSGLTARAVGDTWGEETHALTVEELPAHAHTYDKITPTFIDPGVAASVIGIDDINAADTGETGGDEAHNNMQPSFAVKVGVWAT